MSKAITSSRRRVVIGRRDFMKLTGGSAAYALGGAFPAIARIRALSHETIVRMSLVDGLKALASRKVSSHDYCMAALEQAAKFKSYNIFTQTSPAYVREAAAAVDALRKEGKAAGA